MDRSTAHPPSSGRCLVEERPVQDQNRVPQTLKEVDLPGRIRASGATNLKDVGVFFDWEPTWIRKDAGDFAKEELIEHGWTKDRLLNVADGYEHIARITPGNASAAGRAAQLREIARLFD